METTLPNMCSLAWALGRCSPDGPVGPWHRSRNRRLSVFGNAPERRPPIARNESRCAGRVCRRSGAPLPQDGPFIPVYVGFPRLRQWSQRRGHPPSHRRYGALPAQPAIARGCWWVLLATTAAEHGLSEQTIQAMPRVRPAPHIGQPFRGHCRERPGVVPLTVGEQAGVGGNRCSAIRQLQRPVESRQGCRCVSPFGRSPIPCREDQ